MQDAEYFKLLWDNSEMRQHYHESQQALAKTSTEL